MRPPTFRMALVSELRANSYNPNQMSEEEYQKAIESIKQFGFVDPITVRDFETDGLEIVDGEHRWRAAQHLGLKEVPVIVVWVDDDDARQLTIILNELHGRADEGKLAAIVADLASRRQMADLERVLPFRRSQLAAMVSARREAIDWERLQQPAPVVGVPGEAKTRWVERVFRLPTDAAAVVDDAIASARSGEDEDIPPWRALELIAADFLSGR